MSTPVFMRTGIKEIQKVAKLFTALMEGESDDVESDLGSLTDAQIAALTKVWVRQGGEIDRLAIVDAGLTDFVAVDWSRLGGNDRDDLLSEELKKLDYEDSDETFIYFSRAIYDAVEKKVDRQLSKK